MTTKHLHMLGHPMARAAALLVCLAALSGTVSAGSWSGEQHRRPTWAHCCQGGTRGSGAGGATTASLAPARLTLPAPAAALTSLPPAPPAECSHISEVQHSLGGGADRRESAQQHRGYRGEQRRQGLARMGRRGHGQHQKIGRASHPARLRAPAAPGPQPRRPSAVAAHRLPRAPGAFLFLGLGPPCLGLMVFFLGMQAAKGVAHVIFTYNGNEKFLAEVVLDKGEGPASQPAQPSCPGAEPRPWRAAPGRAGPTRVPPQPLRQSLLIPASAMSRRCACSGAGLGPHLAQPVLQVSHPLHPAPHPPHILHRGRHPA